MADDRVWLSNEKGVYIKKLTRNHLQDALALMRESYYTDEPVSNGLRLQECPEAIDDLEQLTIETFEDGTSLVALLEGKILGVSFNKVQTRSKPGENCYFEDFRDFKCKTKRAKENMNVMIQIDAKIDTFGLYGVEKSLELMFLGVSRDCRGLGVGRLLAEATCVLAQSQGIPLVTTIFSSNFSQAIGKRLQWDELCTIPLCDFVYEGKPYSDYTGEHKFLIAMAKKLTISQ